jgi:hypothetical protein
VMDQNVPNSPPTILLPTKKQAEQVERLKREIAVIETNAFGANASMDVAQAKWEEDWKLRLLHGWSAAENVKTSPWKVVGPLKLESLRGGFETAYDPERKVDLEQSFEGAFETVKWQDRKDFVDGKDNFLVTEVYSVRGNGVFYLHRAVTVSESRAATIRLRGDDLLKVWVNGRLVGERGKPERAGDGPLKIKVELRAGENSILVKTVNYEAKLCSFNFKLDAGEGNNLPEDVEAFLGSEKELKPEQRRILTRYYRERREARFQLLFQKFDALKYELAAIEKEIAATMVAKELAKPREAFVLARGEYDKRGEKVERGVPSALPGLPKDAPVNRLGFAQWLFGPEHPLTSRVVVNRFWQQIFGVGLVKTAEDFGVRGEAPSHPKLLDWLAADFREGGWDVKKLMRRIVTSETYRRSAETTAEKFAFDPENRLLARGARFRTDAEVLRDIVLATSGLLSRAIGGPSAKPYEPPGLWEAVSHQNRLRYVVDEGEGRHRRSLYTFWKRQSPPPNMLIFDAPTRESCVLRRGRTTTPLQALTLLNDPQYVAAAEAFARRIQREGGLSSKAKMRFAFRQATSRWPTVKEEAVMRRLVDVQGDAGGWVQLASMLLNLDETITKN